MSKGSTSAVGQARLKISQAAVGEARPKAAQAAEGKTRLGSTACF